MYWVNEDPVYYQSFWTPTTIKGKTMLMKKKLNQFTDPAIMYAAGRVVWVNNSVVKMLVTPPSWKKKQQKEIALSYNHCSTATVAESLQWN